LHLFVDERLTIAKSEEILHKAVSKLRQAAGQRNSNISLKENKIMTLAGGEPADTIIVDTEITAGVITCKYFGCEMSYIYNED
jgi:hypothetical protein